MFQTDKCFQKKGFSVLWKIVLTIFTGGLYAIYWVYQIGKEMANKSKYIIDKSLIYLVLMIAAVLSEYTFALHLLNNSYLYISISIFYEIIVLSLIQNDLNLLIDKKAIK